MGVAHSSQIIILGFINAQSDTLWLLWVLREYCYCWVNITNNHILCQFIVLCVGVYPILWVLQHH